MGIEQIRMNQTKALPPASRFNWSQMESNLHIIKGRPFGVGFEFLAHPFQKGTPFMISTNMISTKYIGMDVHKESVSIAVMNAAGKLVMECVIETKASTILQFIHGLRGDLHVTFEEGTWAAWLYDLLKPYVTEVVVCNPRKNALLKDGSKSDRIDARKLAEQLYMNKIK
jgi:hypothetical protein